MRIVAASNLHKFWEQPANVDSEIHLRAWIEETEAATWKNPNDVKAHFSSASILANNRVCFNIRGNHYRLVAAIDYKTGFVLIKFIGSHRQ